MRNELYICGEVAHKLVGDHEKGERMQTIALSPIRQGPYEVVRLLNELPRHRALLLRFWPKPELTLYTR